MSLNIDLYKARLNAYKTANKTGKIDAIKNQIIDNFLDNPSHYRVTINQEERDVHIVTDKEGVNKILCKPNENIKPGDYVVWEDEYFLCIKTDDIATIQSKGIIQKCTHDIKWINSKNQLVIKPAIVTAKTLYTTGVRDETTHQIPNGMVGIILPHDEETKDLYRKQTFIFNEAKYRVTFYNEVEQPGLLSLICSEEVPDERIDDLENEIAERYDGDGNDRLNVIENPSNPEQTYSIIIDGYDKMMVGFESTYTATVFNNDEEVDKDVKFEIDDTSLATIASQDGKSCKIKPNNNYRFGRFNLKAILVENETVFIEKEIKVVGL